MLLLGQFRTIPVMSSHRLVRGFSAAYRDILKHNIAHLLNKLNAKGPAHASTWPTSGDSQLVKVRGEYNSLSDTAVFLDLSKPNALVHPGVLTLRQLEQVVEDTVSNIVSMVSKDNHDDEHLRAQVRKSPQLAKIDSRTLLTLAELGKLVDDIMQHVTPK